MNLPVNWSIHLFESEMDHGPSAGWNEKNSFFFFFFLNIYFDLSSVSLQEGEEEGEGGCGRRDWWV